MAEGQKTTELLECPTECGVTAEDRDLKPEVLSSSSPTCEEPVSMQSPSRSLPPGLLSMPCLLKELRRDSSPEALPPEKDPATSVIQICPQEDSDSSAYLRSPSSSGHLGDSDTLSSAEEGDVELTDSKPASSNHSDPAPRKSSRRSRSESDASAGVAMAAKKNRCQERQANGGRIRERGKRSQRHKERMRLLRQKREAVAKREDSSTSDSDATAHSSSSSSTASSDNEGGTVGLHPPAGRRGNSMGGVLEEALTRVAAAQRRTEERFRAWMERISRLHSGEDDDQSYSGNPEGQSRISLEETPAAYRIIRLNNEASSNTLKSAHSCVLDPNLLNV
ncbi:protein C18orf25 homolog isoform X2 [Clarias gariepinus]|uniref:protein C18orf25 homolog isoform X2 n=1 Tax=Clarias gariepinus TaxID=13013 RepID=UPI00234DA5B6|nr:protein C18orf25 homolog isoform X2 [Clarias gariepinus]